jgi:AcrR family transcriptional regulator
MAVRLTRTERKERTRADLIAAARRVFLREGFHAASLDAIAEEAGFTKGAVYSNFTSKDDLFLAVLDDYYENQVHAYRDVLFEDDSAEDSYRTAARVFMATQAREPRWTPLVIEFTAHATRREPLRRAVVEIRERFLDAVGEIIAELGRRHGLEYRVPAREVARGSGAMMRGMAVERLLDPDAVPTELFEELHSAYMRGTARNRTTERNEP